MGSPAFWFSIAGYHHLCTLNIFYFKPFFTPVSPCIFTVFSLADDPFQSLFLSFFKKGDAVFSKFVVDVKEYARSFGLTKAVWGKIGSDAVKQGKRPALNIVLGDNDGRKVRVWVISDSDFQEYVELLEQYELQQMQEN